MTWLSPLPLYLCPTPDTFSFQVMPAGATGLPITPHPGAFAVQRCNHVHEGVDLYAAPTTPVFAVEAGRVTAVKPFTGPALGQPWWLPTFGVWVEGATGVVLYGEIESHVKVGDTLTAGQQLGAVVRVLRNFKGRPTSMLHLELHIPGSTEAPEWYALENRPEVLRDPTPYLLQAATAQAALLAFELGSSVPDYRMYG